MKEIKMSGERLFLLYAFPCAKSREHRGLITAEDLSNLETIVDNGTEPSRSFLEKCFPEAVQSFYNYSEPDISDGRWWPLSLVKRFWHRHEGKTPSCAVWNGTVVTIHDRVVLVVTEIGVDKTQVIKAVNRYKLPLSVGDHVYVHQHVIAEVTDLF